MEEISSTKLTSRDNQDKPATEEMRRITPKFNKTDARYWERKVVFQTRASRTYSVQIQFKGERRYIGLGTASKEEAAVLALHLYHDIRANGWEAVMSRRRGNSAEKKVNVTIGQYIEAVTAKSLIHPKTIQSYAKALRKIAGDIAGETKRGKREAIKLRTLTPERIEAWRIDFIRRNATDPLKEKSARISANAFLGRARALFSSQTVARVRDSVELPEPVPFKGIKVEYVRVPRYRSSFNMVELLEAAREELAAAHPEQFKIFLLGAMAGLRRNEIDKLPWTAFRWDEGLIRIEATQFFRPKSRDSEGDVHIDSELLEIFRGYHARRKGEFVIESDYPPSPGALYDHYRCEREIKSLTNWLRSKGVVSKTPLHCLRKEFGSQIDARYGLTAAQEQLRHANIGVTAAHYVENKRRSVLGFGHLLSSSERVIVPIEQAS
jgi:site-specific recombinase XerC